MVARQSPLLCPQLNTPWYAALQSTVKPPAVWNFTRITLPFVYILGVGGYTIIMYVGESYNLMWSQTPGTFHWC